MINIDVWSIIQRRKLLIAGTAFSVFAAAVIYMFLQDPIYNSSCQLLLVDDKNTDIGQNYVPHDFIILPLGKSDPVMTQLELIKKRPVIEEVIKRCDIRNKSGRLMEYKEAMNKFKFEQIVSTNIIKITCSDKSSERAALYANTLAKVFLEQNQDFNREEIKNVVIFLENQLLLQKRKVNDAQKMVVEFKTKWKTVSLSEETSIRVTALAELEAERINLESELRGLQAQDAEIKRRLSAAGSQAVPEYISLLNAREQTDLSITNVTARLSAVGSQIDEKYRKMTNIPVLEIELAKLEREERIMNEIYTNLLARYEEYKIREAAQVGSIKIVEPAIPDQNPVFPRKKPGILLSLLAGLTMGLGLAFMSEYMKDRLYNIDDVPNILKTTFLGSLPLLHKEKALFMKDNPGSAPAEAMRLIHTNLKYKGVLDKEHIVLMITSARLGEGKSISAVNLAISFASQGKKTVLVNLDFRRPSFEKFFGRKFSNGLSEYLIGDISMGQIFWYTDFVSNLAVVAGGKIPHNPTDLTASSKMKFFVDKMRESFDVVILDTSPVTMVAETLEIARGSIDGIILVSDLLSISRKELVGMRYLLEDKKLPVLGVVVNKVGRENIGYY